MLEIKVLDWLFRVAATGEAQRTGDYHECDDETRPYQIDHDPIDEVEE